MYGIVVEVYVSIPQIMLGQSTVFALERMLPLLPLLGWTGH